jgi:hypothetical protein
VALLLRIKDPQFFRKRSTGAPIRTIDLGAEACPTIMATGLRSVTTDKYWIEDDGAPHMTDPAKPPYRVPSMAEVAAVRPNGLKVISTFAGCGGSSLGYRMAGFKVLWASEFVEAARAVYQANAAPGTIVDGRDIREVDPLEVLRSLKLKPGELDVLDGSPPVLDRRQAGEGLEQGQEVQRHGAADRRPLLRIRPVPQGDAAEGVRRGERLRAREGDGEGLLPKDPRGDEGMRLRRRGARSPPERDFRFLRFELSLHDRLGPIGEDGGERGAPGLRHDRRLRLVSVVGPKEAAHDEGLRDGVPDGAVPRVLAGGIRRAQDRHGATVEVVDQDVPHGS